MERKKGCGKRLRDRDGLTFAICGEKGSLCSSCLKIKTLNEIGTPIIWER